MPSDKTKLLAPFSALLLLSATGASVYALSRLGVGGGLFWWYACLLASASLLSCALIFALSRIHARRIAETRRTSDEALRRARESDELNARTVESLAIAIDAKDQTTHGHVRRTRVYAAELGKLLGVSSSEMEALKAGALLHDIGKLAVPDYLLNKPGRLTAAEFEKMKVHAVVGGDIIRRVGFPYPVEEIVRHHHERWDGTGYPAGLKGEEIPLVARIISGVGAFVENVARFDSLISTQDSGEQVWPAGESRTSEPAAAEKVAGESVAVRPRRGADSSARTREAARGLDADGSTRGRDADHSRGFRSIADAQREVFALHEFAQAVGASLNLQDPAALVAARLRAVVPFDTCVIFAVEERTGQAAPVHAAGEHAEFFSARRVPVGEGITGWVIANARPMCAAHPEIDMRGVPAEIASGVRGVISAPLVREEGAFGAITLYTQDGAAYDAERLRLLESVCLHASSALGNAITHERTKESALTDPVTELPNARALRLLLDQRVAECQRTRRGPLSLLSVDVDDFRLVNEELGHGVGDRLLAAVAAVVRAQLRQMDMLARCAGDEFVAVLPSASEAEAAMVAERIRAAVESQKFQVKAGRAVQLSVSVGVSNYPEAGETADDLLLAATQNMRRNKHARKHSDGNHASVIPIDAYR